MYTNQCNRMHNPCCIYVHMITICVPFVALSLCSHSACTLIICTLYVAILVLNFYLQRFALHHVSTVHAHHPTCVAVVLAGLEVPAV